MESSLTHHILVAMPLLDDAFFARSVVYIVQHDSAGAMGVIINKPVAMTEAELLSNLDIFGGERADAPPLVFGGPVMRERGFILHGETGEWESSLNNDHWGITTSRDIMQDLAVGKGPAHYQICLGHAGWGEGQLEQELAANAWLTVPATRELVFDPPPYERYETVLTHLGIDLSQLGSGGNA